MPEKINRGANTTTARFLAVAVSLAGKDREFKGQLLAEACLTLNGVELPLQATLDKLADEFTAQVEVRSAELAADLVCGAGLEPALRAMHLARRKVLAAVQEVHQKLRESSEYAERVKPL